MIKKFILKNRGITLLEVVITTAIFSLIIGVVGSFARDIFYYDDVFSGGLTSYDEARQVLQPIASEIRSASPSSIGSYPIEKADNTEFIFFTDINNDGIKERIRYFLYGDTFKRGVTVPSGSPLAYLSANEKITELMHGVRNGSTAIFSYYNSSYNGSTAALTQPVSIFDIRLVKILLILDEDPSRPPAAVTVTTQVNIRNLKDNL
ncbi:prepilin-type N-terminal cleavage/methylation domain-containing protein [Candidatus Nomurabacteria bacterium]|nr:prepilin-type N-terminal cleavage/methylation domain-containing protein [Candidatus Nomurabacteria bacterium]